jgi:Asp-tRNA(Asn)/Glu-tRNA(Gln) amidotransferase A subunit family amidase
MQKSGLMELSVSALIPKLRDRDISAVQLVDQCIARIEAREDAVGAWAFFNAEQSRRVAAELDRGPVRGILHGIPVGVKDIIDVAGMPTECGTPVYRGRLAARDASCIQRIRDAGGIPIGKTVATEFSYFKPGKTANPRNLSHTPGGSSSGSAAAVADWMVPVALGAQTAGSVIRPAAFCGVIGFKSSHGAVALDGVEGLAPSLDSLGWFVREVEDAEVMRAVLAGDSYRPLSDAPATPRIAVCETHEWRHADARAQENFHRAAEQLGRAGAEISVLSLPAEFAALYELHVCIMSYEAARLLGGIADQHADQISPQLGALIASGRRIDAAVYDDARRRVAMAIEKLDSLFGNFDAILAPSAPGEAPAGLQATGDPVFSRVWTLLKGPSVALPVGAGAHGLPLGVQLIGRLNADRQLLAVAKRVQPWLAPV